jgi:NhaP-type Na+/H+ or K+/H+ antiporter
MGLFLLLFGLTSYVIRGRFFLTTAPIAMLCGIALGPKGAGYVKRDEIELILAF